VAPPRLASTLAPLVLRLRHPLVTARATYAAREGWLLALRDGEGRVGQGEAMPLPEFGTEDRAACGEALAHWAAAAGPVPETPGALGPWLAPLEAAPAARHAAEQAALVLQALRHGLPLARWLAGSAPGARAPRDAVAVNALLAGTTPEALAAEGARAVAEGFSTLKVKVAGRPLAEDVRRLEALRGAVGPSVRLRLDANGGWGVEGAREALAALCAGGGVELCEQPVPAADVPGLAALRGRVPCAVGADEALGAPGAARAVLAAGAADVLVLKPMVLGGLLPALALAAEAARRGLGAFVTSALDGPVARAGGAHLMAVLPTHGEPLAAGLAVGHLFSDEPAHPYHPLRGAVHLPQAAGLGLAPPGAPAR
jgi:o-succinylbenzoate synthase